MSKRLRRVARLVAALVMVGVPTLAVVTVGGEAPAAAEVRGPLVATHSGLCVGIPNASQSNGTAATQDECDGGDDQSIEMRDAGGGRVELVVKHSGLCLAVQAASTSSEALVIQTDCNGATNSQWTATPVTGGLQLQVSHTGMCLDVYGGGVDPGAALIQWPCHGNANQVFDWQSAEVGGGGTGCVAGLSAEAEDGVLSGEMVAVPDGSASGGSFVEVPEGSGDYWSLGSASRVELCFDVAVGGRYRIETLARGQVGSNSFFVTVDGAPASGFVWDVRKASGFVTDDVADRGGADPVEVDLGVGSHSVVFHHRKDGTRLDSVTLVRTDTGGGGGGPRNTTGAWDPVVDVGLVPVAMANIPSGEVLLWSAYGRFTFGGERGYTETAIYNPSTGSVRAQRISNTQHDMFCPGIANLSDGRVLVSGGSGNAETSIYNPATDSWEDAADMNIGRGYQGNVTLGDGSVLTVGGSWSGGVGDKASEIYRNGSWTVLPGIVGSGNLETADAQGQYRADNHMWLFAWTGNRVFHAGPSRTMHWLDVSGQGSVSSAGTRGSDGDAMNGNAVMYDAGKILVVGGAPDYDNSTGTGNAHIIDLNNGASVRQIPSLATPRALHNSVVLPSGEVVVTGGQRITRLFTDDQAVLEPELFDPDTETWSTLASMAVPRTYHSGALLLTDGRVMVGGGGLCGSCATNHPDTQILTPPYLLTADGDPRPRPTITSAPSSASHGSTIPVGVSGGASNFALVRMANATHSVNNAQRRIPLTFSGSGSSYQVTIPGDPGVAPPGAYMLFVLDTDGTPSVARLINLA